MKRRSAYMLILLLGLAVLLFTTGSPLLQANFVAPQTPVTARHEAYQLNDREKQVMRQVGQVPYITDVLFDETKDGKLIVAATAEIGSGNEPDKHQLAREIALKYTAAVYRSGVPVAQATIHITADNHLLLGTSLGSEHQKKLSQSVMAGTGSVTGEFFQFLKQNETDSSEPEKNTWMYEIR
ncbi:hypothetical protein [Effusibacillus pohliae]|uniref:hypothetical protein n=1 Tax=Effusibacillus pohliae TaxID=232270 RepID=UPI000379968D|nr:hypothetical protein [Effusibacillus pohliae]